VWISFARVFKVPYTIIYMFRLHRSSKSVALIIDISSGSVGASLVRFPANQKQNAIVLYSARHTIADERIEAGQLEKAMISALMEAILALKNSGESLFKSGVKVDSAYLFFGSPWRAVTILRPSIASAQAFIPNHKQMNDKIDAETSEWLKNLQPSPVWVDGQSDQELLTEKILLSRAVNGYMVFDWGKERVYEMTATVLASVLPSSIDKGVGAVIRQAFPRVKVTAHPALQSLIFALNKTAVRGRVVLMRLTETVTDVAVMANGIPLAISSFPMGRQTILRTFADISGESLSSSSSHVELYLRKEEDENEAKKTGKILQDAGIEWRKGFMSSIKECADIIPIPGYMLLLCDSALHEKWFVEQVKSIDMSSVAFFREVPHIDIVGAKHLRYSVETKKDKLADALSSAEITFSQYHL
jgi:hypothetical protein